MKGPSRTEGACRDRRPCLPGVLAATLLVSMSLGSAPEAALKAGEAAPDITLRDRTGVTVRYDRSITTPTLFLSLKPADRYASHTLGILRATFERLPQLDRGLNRWIVVSRFDEDANLGFLDALPIQGWRVFVDPNDTFYLQYKIIATPTITLVGKDHVVFAVHPGYDPGMAHHVRISVASLVGADLPKTVTAAAEKPNMTLQMARRMAQRGLWDKALSYYQKAGDQEPLSDLARIEMAEVHLELAQPKEALEAIRGIESDASTAPRLQKIRERAAELGKPRQPAATPPKVYR